MESPGQDRDTVFVAPSWALTPRGHTEHVCGVSVCTQGDRSCGVWVAAVAPAHACPQAVCGLGGTEYRVDTEFQQVGRKGF